MSKDEGSELVRLAKKYDRILMVGHLLIYHPAINFIKSFLKEGHLGRVYSFYSVRRNLGTVRSFENVYLSVGIHDAAILFEIYPKEILSVKTEGYSVINKEIYDDLKIDLTFEDGFKAHLHMNWLWPYKERNFIIQGEKGFYKI